MLKEIGVLPQSQRMEVHFSSLNKKQANSRGCVCTSLDGFDLDTTKGGTCRELDTLPIDCVRVDIVAEVDHQDAQKPLNELSVYVLPKCLKAKQTLSFHDTFSLSRHRRNKARVITLTILSKSVVEY